MKYVGAALVAIECEALAIVSEAGPDAIATKAAPTIPLKFR